MAQLENIQVFHPQLDIDEYLRVLREEFGAQEDPDRPRSYLVNGVSFHHPQQAEEYVYILGLGHVMPSGSLIEALVNHPELVPEDVMVKWWQEQHLIGESTVGELRTK